MSRHRTLTQQLMLGVVVCAVAVLGGAVIVVAGQDGIAAVNHSRPQRAILAGAVCLASVIVPVVALAAYLHWLGGTSRRSSPTEVHVPSRAEDALLGLGTLLVVIAAVPVVTYCYTRARAHLESTDLTAGPDLAAGIGLGVLGLAVIAFVLFCVSRYVRWLRD